MSKFAKDATRQLVIEYLLANYKCTPHTVEQIVKNQFDILRNGIERCSYANYVGDKIAEAEELHPIVKDEEE